MLSCPPCKSNIEDENLITFLYQGITDMFRTEDTDLDGKITITYENFLSMILNSTIM